MLGKAVTLRSSDPSDAVMSVAATIIDGEGFTREWNLLAWNNGGMFNWLQPSLRTGFTITNGYVMAGV